MMILAILLGLTRMDFRPVRRAASASAVLGPQSNSVTAPAGKTYTLAGPTAYGVGTTIRSNRSPRLAGTAPQPLTGAHLGIERTLPLAHRAWSQTRARPPLAAS